ncbi:hypothetical protein DL93DRAFT_2186416 [Clavulina sp. PMI_390]|nr:hypothetical protein DL93DRAFT_2186416 [Clavulina sp. PMI_390]
MDASFEDFDHPNSTLHAKRKSPDYDESEALPRKRPHLDNTRDSLPSSASSSKGPTRYWMVQWRKPQNKKHKTWDGDGVLVVNDGSVELLNLDRQRIVFARNGATSIREGEVLNLGGKEICVDHSITPADFISGVCFDIGDFEIPPPRVRTPVVNSSMPTSIKPGFKPLIPKVSMRPALTPTVPSPASRTLVAFPADHPRKESVEGDKTRFWTAQWRKPQTKKNKSWDGDGYLSQCGTKVVFMDEDCAPLGSISWKNGKLKSGDMLYIGAKEVCVDARIAELPRINKTTSKEPEEDKRTNYSTLPKVVAKFKPPVVTKPPPPPNIKSETPSADAPKSSGISAASFYGTKKHLQLHDPNAPNALVMPSPDNDHQRRFNKKKNEVVPVVIDPVIGNKLRPHQRDGVTFMYQCVMGMAKHDGQGCILADEMGLGKTIQTIALIWTLLRQNPYANSGSIAGKVLIVCPVSLLKNWKKEIHKWLGKDRIDILVGDKELSELKRFRTSRHHVLIIGYERLRSVINEFAVCRPPIGLIVCDEGHRLKSADSKTTKMFDVLDVPRRIILSGTPVQNNLGEFHAMANFCNPGLLDSYKTFYRMFEQPIMRSREPNCTNNEREEGIDRAEQLTELSRSFVLRRTADILSNYLPPKNEYVVFVRPTSIQLSMFEKILSTDKLDSLISRNTITSLALITNLMQLCNSPLLLLNKQDKLKDDNVTHAAIKSALKILPKGVKEDDMEQSGKMIALASILKTLRVDTDEKVVIVSHYTATLDLIETHCRRKKYGLYRLDGKTRADDRQKLVDDFNRSSQRDKFVFLLSTKAGGVGLNLVGASRLILVDSDWNPSHDLQAMARIHRDGQKRPVFIYRLLTAGTIDEKIFQRAITKMGLSESLIGGVGEDASRGAKGDSFSRDELRDLFSVNMTTSCGTHDLIGCRCISGTVDGIEPEALPEEADLEELESDIEDWDDPEGGFSKGGFMPASQYKPPKEKKSSKREALSALSEWTHVHCENPSSSEYIHDATLLKVITSSRSTVANVGVGQSMSLLDAIDTTAVDSALDDRGKITFVFEKISKADADKPEGEEGED